MKYIFIFFFSFITTSACFAIKSDTIYLSTSLKKCKQKKAKYYTFKLNPNKEYDTLKYYYLSGVLYQKVCYWNGIKNGESYHFNEGNETTCKTNYLNGEKTGNTKCTSKTGIEYFPAIELTTYPIFGTAINSNEGNIAFANFLKRELKNTNSNNETSIQGRVYVSFFITDYGEVINVKILRGINKSIDNKILEVLNSSPKWTPATINGKKVTTCINVPIAYQ